MRRKWFQKQIYSRGLFISFNDFKVGFSLLNKTTKKKRQNYFNFICEIYECCFTGNIFRARNIFMQISTTASR